MEEVLKRLADDVRWMIGLSAKSDLPYKKHIQRLAKSAYFIASREIESLNKLSV